MEHHEALPGPASRAATGGLYRGLVVSGESALLNRQTIRRFLRAIKDLLTSDIRRPAIGLLILLGVGALSVSGLNVVNSYVGRDFMTAIAHKDMAGFGKFGVIYIVVFMASTAVAVLYRFTEERLGLLWRSWLTHRVTNAYLNGRTYFRLRESEAIDNPDQRIADGIHTFTTTTLSFALIFANATLAAISFSGVLWMISPKLFGVAVGYAVVGTIISIYLGRPLLGLNYRQADCEADFRAALINVRENAESIAVTHHEGRVRARLHQRIDKLVDNFRRIISVNRNLGFFTSGYNYLIQIIPTLIIAPSFIRGEIEFGVITQSGMAFAQLLGAFSVIVNQFSSLSSFAAVVARLGEFAEAADSTPAETSGIEIVEEPSRVAFDRLTLRTQQGEMLIDNLTANVPSGTRMLITGSNEAARITLFRALADIWPHGQGRITRPPLDSILFLPQSPYLAPGTLREMLMCGGQDQTTDEQQIKTALTALGLETEVGRVGGLDIEFDSATMFSLGEQQLLALIRLLLAKPTFVVLDRPSSTLSRGQLPIVFRTLTERAISYITFEETEETRGFHDAVLRLNNEGQWELRTDASSDVG